MMKIYAHRGAMGEYPENTMLAFEKAIEAGVDGLEIDVHMGRDGEIVVIHDEHIDRTTDGEGPIKDMVLSEIKEYSAGSRYSDYDLYDESWDRERIPTLVEVLQLVQNHDIMLNIELKTNVFPYKGIERKVARFISNYNLEDRVIYSSFHLPTLVRMKEAAPEAKLAWLTKKLPRLVEDHVETLELDALHIDYRRILKHPSRIEGVEENIRAWTVNEVDDARMLLELGVDAIMTDYPEKLVKARADMV